MITFLLIAGYLACAVLAYGLTLHDFEREFPGLAHDPSDRRISAVLSLAGPISLVIALTTGRPWGLRWRHVCARSIAEHAMKGGGYCPKCISPNPTAPWPGPSR